MEKFKLLIVDDEEIEREGMAKLINWEKYDIELVGTARNGREGYQCIQENKLDIVITDIKMPVMNGVELVKKTAKAYPDIIMIVLSGYGDYEYTSQVMEYGVKYYILKPCNEDKLAKVLNKAKADLQSRYLREKEDYIVLLAKAKIGSDYIFLSRESIDGFELCRLIVCKTEEGTEILGQFVELKTAGPAIRNNISTYKPKQILAKPFALSQDEEINLLRAVKYIFNEDNKENGSLLIVNNFGNLMEVRKLNQWPPKPFPKTIISKPQELLDAFIYQKKEYEIDYRISFLQIKNKEDYKELLFELNLIYCKFLLKNHSIADLLQMSIVLVGTLYHISEETLLSMLPQIPDKKDIYRAVQQIVAEAQYQTGSSKDKRMVQILQAIYENLTEEHLGILWLSKNVMFINKDYLGRVFTKCMEEKFSDFVIRIRVETARQLLEFEPRLSIANLAEMVGYPMDAQYFSRVYKKQTGMSPSKYRELLLQKLES